MIPMADMRKQIITGVYSPEQGEAMIRQVFPSVAAFPAVATLGRALICSYVLAPLGWALMIPFYFIKVLPGIGWRYALTNRRVMIQKGLKRVPGDAVALKDIDDVNVVQDANSTFFRSGDIEIISQGKVALKLAAVGEPHAFRLAILGAVRACVPGKADTGNFVPASAMKK